MRSQIGDNRVYSKSFEVSLLGIWLPTAAPLIITNMDRDPADLLREFGRFSVEEWPADAIVAVMVLKLGTSWEKAEKAIEEYYGSTIYTQPKLRSSD
jgi:hypothetical protein